MSAPIFDQLKAERGFDPLEGIEYETIRDATGKTLRTVEVHRAATYPAYKASYDHAQELWAVMKGQPVGDHFMVYQPCAYYQSEFAASTAAWFKNTFGENKA